MSNSSSSFDIFFPDIHNNLALLISLIEKRDVKNINSHLKFMLFRESNDTPIYVTSDVMNQNEVNESFSSVYDDMETLKNLINQKAISAVREQLKK